MSSVVTVAALTSKCRQWSFWELWRHSVVSGHVGSSDITVSLVVMLAVLVSQCRQWSCHRRAAGIGSRVEPATNKQHSSCVSAPRVVASWFRMSVGLIAELETMPTITGQFGRGGGGGGARLGCHRQLPHPRKLRAWRNTCHGHDCHPG